MSTRRIFSSCVVAISLLATIACGDSTGPPSAEPVGAISVTAPRTEIALGANVQLAASVLSQTGAVLPGRSVTWMSSQPLVATISSSGLVRAVASGTSIMSASTGGHRDSVQITVLAGACSAPLAGAIAPGETRSGSLAIGSCLLDFGARASGYALTLTAPTRVRVRITSSQFAPLIFVMDAQQQVVAYGEQTGGTDAATFPRDLGAGHYTIWAAAPAGTGGSFQLTVDQLVIVPCTPVGSIGVGQTVSGSLLQNGCLPEWLPDQVAEPWRLTMTAPGRVQIRVSSSAFDGMLFVTSANDNVVAAGSAPIANLDAGEYRVWVTAHQPGSAGAYQLSIEEGPPACVATTIGSVSPGQIRAGSLPTSACILLDGPAVQGWGLTLESATRVRIHASSAAFVPLVALTDETLGLRSWTMSNDGVNAVLNSSLQPGSYIIWVGTFDGDTGSYQLEVQEIEPCASAGSLSPGVVSGSLSSGDCVGDLRPDSYVDVWRMELTGTTQLRLDMVSVQFDAYLIILDAQGRIIAYDDDGGANYDARITVTLPAGVYEVWATSYAPHATGDYQLSMAATAAALADASPAAGQPRTDSRRSPWVRMK